MTAATTAGSKLYIGTTADIDFTSGVTALADFVADAYTEIKEVEDLGDFGDESAEVEFTAVGDSRKRRYKGTRDAGVMAVVCGRDPLDAGQRAAIAAEKVKDAYNIKVVLNDGPVGGTPSTFYFRALVMSAKNALGSVDNIMKLNLNLAINSQIVEVVAVAGP